MKLRSEREIKDLKSDEGKYSTNGPNDLFDILTKTLDLIKEYKKRNDQILKLLLNVLSNI